MSLPIPAELAGKMTVSVPEAGRIAYGLGRNSSYIAASRGDLPTVRIGNKIRVIVPALLKQLGYETD